MRNMPKVIGTGKDIYNLLGMKVKEQIRTEIKKKELIANGSITPDN